MGHATKDLSWKGDQRNVTRRLPRAPNGGSVYKPPAFNTTCAVPRCQAPTNLLCFSPVSFCSEAHVLPRLLPLGPAPLHPVVNLRPISAHVRLSSALPREVPLSEVA